MSMSEKKRLRSGRAYATNQQEQKKIPRKKGYRGLEKVDDESKKVKKEEIKVKTRVRRVPQKETIFVEKPFVSYLEEKIARLEEANRLLEKWVDECKKKKKSSKTETILISENLEILKQENEKLKFELASMKEKDKECHKKAKSMEDMHDAIRQYAHEMGYKSPVQPLSKIESPKRNVEFEDDVVKKAKQALDLYNKMREQRERSLMTEQRPSTPPNKYLKSKKIEPKQLIFNPAQTTSVKEQRPATPQHKYLKPKRSTHETKRLFLSPTKKEPPKRKTYVSSMNLRKGPTIKKQPTYDDLLLYEKVMDQVKSDKPEDDLTYNEMLAYRPFIKSVGTKDDLEYFDKALEQLAKSQGIKYKSPLKKSKEKIELDAIMEVIDLILKDEYYNDIDYHQFEQYMPLITSYGEPEDIEKYIEARQKLKESES